MPEHSSSITCAFCGSTHTSVREVDARERTMWVDCQDCQRLSPQPYPLLSEAEDRGKSAEPEL